MDEDLKQELLDLNQQLLDCITAADWDTYQQLCDPTLTCFEPEAMGHLVSGMEFHQFYFQLGGLAARAGRQQLYSRPLSLTNRGPYALREEVGI